MQGEKSISMQKCQEQRQGGMKQLGVNTWEPQAVCCRWSIKSEERTESWAVGKNGLSSVLQ